MVVHSVTLSYHLGMNFGSIDFSVSQMQSHDNKHRRPEAGRSCQVHPRKCL